ncbi:MAG: hypothetical protein FJX33_00785 [Alphaproteobacteria bacterium]|nr:hypothetical protein [Alphaproteobacteria bacterium]
MIQFWFLIERGKGRVFGRDKPFCRLGFRRKKLTKLMKEPAEMGWSPVIGRDVGAISVCHIDHDDDHHSNDQWKDNSATFKRRKNFSGNSWS